MQTSLCTRIRSAGKAGEKIGTEYPDSVRGAKAHSFRKAFPAPASDRRTCANRKEHTPYSAVLRRVFTPRFSVLARIPREAVFLNMPIFICKLIMNLFVRFVNIFTQKIVK